MSFIPWFDYQRACVAPHQNVIDVKVVLFVDNNSVTWSVSCLLQCCPTSDWFSQQGLFIYLGYFRSPEGILWYLELLLSLFNAILIICISSLIFSIRNYIYNHLYYNHLYKSIYNHQQVYEILKRTKCTRAKYIMGKSHLLIFAWQTGANEPDFNPTMLNWNVTKKSMVTLYFKVCYTLHVLTKEIILTLY